MHIVAICPALPTIANGVMEYHVVEDLFNSTILYMLNGTVATYTCNDGFSLDGNTTTRICDTRNWTGTEPMCIKSKPMQIHTLWVLVHDSTRMGMASNTGLVAW